MGALDKQKTGSGGGSIDADVMEYKGTWAANTNTPTLSNSDTDVEGNTYKVSAAGSTDFGAGSISFEIGDLVINNGTVWEKIEGSAAANITNSDIDANAGISFSKLETVGTDHIIGRTASGSGVVTGLSASQVRAILNVEDGATADQTGAEIKSLYEAESNTNAFTDSEQSKLSGIESGAEVNDVNSVNGQTGTVSLDADDIDDTSTAHKFTTSSDITKLSNIEDNATANPNAFDKTTETLDDITAGTTNKHFTASDESKLDGIESGATADMSDGEIKTAYENNANTNAFTDTEKTKLSGIETGAEVNDVTSVNSQTGAVSLDADDIDDTSTTHKFATASQLSKIDGVESGATADQSDAEIETAYNNQVDIVTQAEAEAGTDTNVHRWTPERVKQAIDSLASGGAATYQITYTGIDTNSTSTYSSVGSVDIPGGKDYIVLASGYHDTNSTSAASNYAIARLNFSGFGGTSPTAPNAGIYMTYDTADFTNGRKSNPGGSFIRLSQTSTGTALSGGAGQFKTQAKIEATSTTGTITVDLEHAISGGSMSSRVFQIVVLIIEV